MQKGMIAPIDPSYYMGKVICFDTETTGLTKTDEIIQISILNEDEQNILTTLVAPEYNVEWPEAQAVNGISPEMVKEAPTMKNLYPYLKDIFDGASEILGYNVKFDIRMVEQCCPYRFDQSKVTDVIKQVRKDKEKPYKLCDAVAFYLPGFAKEFSQGAHKADMDTLATIKVWKAQKERQHNTSTTKNLKLKVAAPKRPNTQNTTHNGVILLPEMCYYTGIGSIGTPQEILEIFERMGFWLANKGLTLRSGRADGADIAFEKGCDRADKENSKAINLPWNCFNIKHYDGPCQKGSKISCRVGSVANQIMERFHPNVEDLTNGARLLRARNVYQFIGVSCESERPVPSAFVICHTPYGHGEGVTGEALQIAKYIDIPIFDAGRYEKKDHSIDSKALIRDFNLFYKEAMAQWRQNQAQRIQTAKHLIQEVKEASKDTSYVEEREER